MQKKLTIALLATTCLALAAGVQGQSLKGSKASMDRQHREALRYGYTFIQNGQGVSDFVASGHLVTIERGRHVDLHDVSYPYARPAVKTFVDRLSAQYFAQCSEKLTVTSLTRPKNRQPANASSESVHPTGMAVDLRIPPPGKCRSWLEKTLLELESGGLLDVTRERNPPHYHVAVFTQHYEQYAQQKASAPVHAGNGEYVVRRGDTLSVIASRTGATIAQLRAANGLRGDLIRAGQKLVVPGTDTPVALASAASNDVAAVTEVTHRVRRGETLWRIANLYGTSINLVRMHNGLADDFLQVGQVLKISLGN
jgi:LysM repeat protein